VTPHELYLEARKRGLRLEAVGDKLAVMPKGQCPDEFKATLLEHKTALLAWLRGGADYWHDRQKPDLNLPDDFLRTCTAGNPFPRGRGFQPGLTSDKGGSATAWLHVAVQVNAGEFEGADASTIEAVYIGLWNIPHPAVREALRRLAAEQACPADVKKDIRKLLA
jgi:hypothetical protein